MIEQKRAILTVEHDLSEKCWGVPVDTVKNRHLREALVETAKEFVRARELHGQRFVETGGIHVYGPFPTAEYLVPLVDHEDLTTDDHDALVRQRDIEGAFNHYLLNADFHTKE